MGTDERATASEARRPGADPERGIADPAGGQDGGASPRKVRAVGAIVFDPSGRLLLIRRGHEPGAGLWSIPGGKVEAGESNEQAVAREILEETGLRIRVGALAGMVTRPGLPGTVYDIYDYDATILDDRPADDAEGHAASDAADLRWVEPAALDSLPLTDGLVSALRAWGRLP